MEDAFHEHSGEARRRNGSPAEVVTLGALSKMHAINEAAASSPRPKLFSQFIAELFEGSGGEGV